MTEYLSVQEAADLLELDQTLIHVLCRNGNFPGAVEQAGQNTWQIPTSAIDAYRARQTAANPSSPDSMRSQLISRDNFNIGNINQSNVAIGSESRLIVNSKKSTEVIANYFETAYQRLETRLEDPNVDKTEIKETIKKIEQEVTQQEPANPNKIERWMKILEDIAPDILDVIVAGLLNPGSAVATVVRKVAERARSQASQS